MIDDRFLPRVWTDKGYYYPIFSELGITYENKNLPFTEENLKDTFTEENLKGINWAFRWRFNHSNENVDMEYINTLEQCTGLKDKNGKLIYEGDIVEFYAQSFLDALSRKDLQRRVGKVVWNDEELKFDVVVGNEAVPNLCREIDDNQFVIIGNIHKNPELLEEYNAD